MLVSHRYRFIYTKTAKTGGTSVESYFERFCMEDGAWEQVHAREMYESSAGIIGYRGRGEAQAHRWWNHMPAARIRHQLGKAVWEDYFKFCVVRNPFEKCISAFEHAGVDHTIGCLSGLPFRLATIAMTPEQRRFLHWLRRTGPPIDRAAYVIDGDFCMDDVIRYESLEAGLERICRRLDLPWEPSLLPTFKTGLRREEATVQNLYTPAARRLVERAFAFEIDRFGYRFPHA